MEQNKNSDSRRARGFSRTESPWDDGDQPRPRRLRRRPGEICISSADWEPPGWSTTPAGQRGELSPHLKPGRKTWVGPETGG